MYLKRYIVILLFFSVSCSDRSDPVIPYDNGREPDTTLPADTPADTVVTPPDTIPAADTSAAVIPLSEFFPLGHNYRWVYRFEDIYKYTYSNDADTMMDKIQNVLAGGRLSITVSLTDSNSYYNSYQMDMLFEPKLSDFALEKGYPRELYCCLAIR